MKKTWLRPALLAAGLALAAPQRPLAACEHEGHDDQDGPELRAHAAE